MYNREGRLEKMPTIKDIALAAGVSHGTVSNVLNKKGNVSLDKIKLVTKTAEKMGYQLNASAKQLRQGKTKTIALILPNINLEQYYNLYIGMNNFLKNLGYHINLYTTDDQMNKEIAILQKISSNRDNAVVTVSCLDHASKYYQILNLDVKNINFVLRKPHGAKQFISVDYSEAGKAIANSISEKKYQHIGVFLDLMSYSNSKQLKKSLDAGLDGITNDLHYVSSSHADIYNKAYSFFKEQPFDIIITSDIERARALKSAHYFSSTKKFPKLYSLASADLTIEKSVIKYQFNYQLLGEKLAKQIIKNEKKQSFIIENKGFVYNYESETTSAASKSTLNILMLPSPSTESLRTLIPNFKKKTGIKINITIRTFEEIYDILSDIEKHNMYDIIRIDMASLPWFAKSAFKPLNSFLGELISDYPQSILQRFSYVNNIPYAIPFDPSIQMLFYRKDIFDDFMVQRMFYEKYNRKLKPPTNFNDYNLISKFFSQDYTSKPTIQKGTSVTTGNTEIIASEFLLRYYAENGTLIKTNKKIALNKHLAKKAFSTYFNSLEQAMNLSANWWDASVLEFIKGNLAMIIVYTNLFSDIHRQPDFPSLGFADVPGGKPLLGGGSLGVSRFSDKEDEINQFFSWLNSEEIAEQNIILGGTTFNQVALNNPLLIDRYPWLKYALKTEMSGIRETSSQSPGRFDLRKVEKIIGNGVKNVINQHISIDQSINYINKRLAEEIIIKH